MKTTTVRNAAKIFRLLSCLSVLFVSAQLAQAQSEQEAMGICFPAGKNTAVVRSGIGGEAHDSWVFHVAAGRKVTVRITSTRNRAGFTVSTSEFGEQVSFGKASADGNTWTGTIPQTGVYYISVVAHPDARYVLSVTKQ